MSEQDVIDRIRTIFLQRRPRVTIAEARLLLGWSKAEMSRAVGAGEIEIDSASSGEAISREELIAKALEIWTPDAIEDALGADAEAVLPVGMRLTDVHVRLPRHQVAMLEHFAARDHSTISGVLARELDAIASAHTHDLSRAIDGFADALAWPDAPAPGPRC